MRSRFSSESMLGNSDLSSAAREPAGTPSRYRFVSRPCASGLKVMAPAPASCSASRSPSSIQRLSIEYDGWWMSSGTPISPRMRAASSVRRGEYEEMPT